MKSSTYLADSERGGPGLSFLILAHVVSLRLEDAEANLSVCIDVRVVDLASEEALWRHSWIILRAVYLYGEHTSFERCVTRPVHLYKEVSIVGLALGHSDSINWLTSHHIGLLGSSVLCLHHLT